MSYSCPDFVDDVLTILGIRLTDEERNDTEAQADKALAEIRRLQSREALLTMQLHNAMVTIDTYKRERK